MVDCVCREDKVTIKYWKVECERVKEWFVKLGVDKEERWKNLWNKELNDGKEKVLGKVWIEREIELKE